MKKINRCLAIVLAMMLFVLGIGAESFAVESRASYYFYDYDISVTKTADRTFRIDFYVEAPSTMKEIGVEYIKIQRSDDGTSWSTIKTLYESSYSDFIVTNTDENSSSVTYTGNSGYYYRVYTEFYAEDSSGSSSKIVYSNKVKLT